ncbi:MAG: NAD(P)H-dependent oxidoreductase subunit E [Gammaproteobacteria bacterium]|nr:NAD(P)H-dependent oxidoreductase subunit E [Gammaproteobacteria bacterium]
MEPMSDMSGIDDICERHARRDAPLLPILHEVQDRFGYISDAAIRRIAEALNLTRAEVFGVVSFYHDFRDRPARRRRLRVCRAEACQAVGGREVWAAAEALAAEPDSPFEVQAVYCLGNCACAPSVQLDGRTLGRFTPERVSRLAAAKVGRSCTP